MHGPCHAWTCTAISEKLSQSFGFGDGGPGGWWIVFEPELHLSADIVVPDVAGWRRDTMPDYPASAYCEIPPDWVCEVLSPSTRRIDQIEKRVIYVREKVSHLRFIDPDEKTMEAFEWRQGYWVLPKTLADNEPASIAPFEVTSFPLDSL